MSCTLPEDPALNPNSSGITIFTDDNAAAAGKLILMQGESKKIGVQIYLPTHIEKVQFSSTCNLTFPEYIPDSLAEMDTVYITPTFATVGTCTLEVTAVLKNKQYRDKTAKLPINIQIGTPGITITSLPTTNTAKDTLVFTALLTGGAVPPVSWQITTLPVLDASKLGQIYSANKDTLKLTFTDAAPDTYTVSVAASAPVPAATGLLVSATATTGIRIQSSIAPALVHAPEQIAAGKADTLRFAVDNSTRPDPLTIQLKTDKPLDPSIFTIVPSGADSVIIAISPTATSGSANIGIITSNGTTQDTTWYPVTIISQNDALWNTTEVFQNAVEGTLLIIDLKPYLSAVHALGISVSADIGNVSSDNVWGFTPPWGCTSTLSATITAIKGSISLPLKIKLNVVGGDANKPLLALVDQSLDGKKVSASQVTIECEANDSGAGIGSVTLTCGTQTVPATLQHDAIYSGVIAGLEHGVPAKIIITATDASRAKNFASVKITVTRDSTILDAEAPGIVQQTGPKSGERVTEPTGTIGFSVTDNSGIDSVWWTLNGVFMGAVTAADNVYTIGYTLSAFKENIIALYAKDRSGAGNEGFSTISLNYNTIPAAITLLTPVANASGVSKSTIFKWSSGEDADGDGITYAVHYGTTQGNLVGKAAVSGLTATAALEYNKTYYWQVTGKSTSAAYPDEVLSLVGTFSTEGSLPLITADPQSQSVEAGQSVTFKVTASGFGTLSYHWRQNGTNINGATSNSYPISSVTLGMNNTTYDCVVKNEVGEVTSKAATLTVTAIPSYTVSFVTDGGLPKPESQTLLRGDKATVPTTNPVRGGYRFTGWFELNSAHEFYFTQTAITADLTIYAGWKKVYTVTYHKNADEGGSVPTEPAVFDSGAVVTVLGNTGNLTKSGYEFKGWTTASNGTGSAVTTISANSDVDLYPKWAAVFTVTFDGQGATTAPNPPIKMVSSPATTVASLPTDPKKRGYSFIGWNTGTGSPFTATTIVTASITVFANWEIRDSEGNTYTETIINGKVWMNKNYHSTKLNDGTSIIGVQTVGDWTNGDPAKIPCYYSGSCGIFYNDLTIKSGKLAPDGWRVPTSSELGLAAGSFSSVCCMGSLQISYMDGAVIYGNGTSACYWSSTLGTHGGHIFRTADCSTGASEEVTGAQDNYGCCVRLVRDY